jgi:hypothetical protein
MLILTLYYGHKYSKLGALKQNTEKGKFWGIVM